MTQGIDGFVDGTDLLDVVDIGQMDVASEESVHFTRKRTTCARPEQVVSLGDRDADSVILFLNDTPVTTLFSGLQTIKLEPARALECSMHDLRPTLAWRADYELDVVTFDVPTLAVSRWAQENDERALGGLQFESGIPHTDEVIKGFGMALLPFTANPSSAPRLFVDLVLDAVCNHLVRTYGAARQSARQFGGLAPWQERRVKEKIAASLDKQISLQSLADECRLSVSHFAKAFRDTVGETPHRWLLQRRIEHSKDLLNDATLSLAEIAVMCGFADQSHFTRAFAQREGVAPGAWRRARAPEWIPVPRRPALARAHALA